MSEIREYQCRHCGDSYGLEVDPEMFQKWEAGEILIQEAFSNLTAGERELMISGTCDTCWDAMFGEDEEDEDYEDEDEDEETSVSYYNQTPTKPNWSPTIVKKLFGNVYWTKQGIGISVNSPQKARLYNAILGSTVLVGITVGIVYYCLS